MGRARRTNESAVRLWWLLLTCLWAQGCAQVKPTPKSHAEPGSRWQALAQGRFESGILFKPLSSGQTGLALTLAPIIIQESNPSEGSQDFPARSAPLAPGVWGFESAVEIHGRPHPQVSYVWQATTFSATGTNESWAGVRITLGTSGQPVIWEILSSSSEERVFFVAESLEAAAHREWGAALPGRLSSIEPSSTEAHTVVARVLSDGPVPMGPIVYVEQHTGAIRTVLCRCMPAQLDHITTGPEYELRFLHVAGGFGLDEAAAIRLIGKHADTGGLRLPRDF